MSLITMTFAKSESKIANSIGQGKIKVLKTDKFYGDDGICVIGKLIEGAVSKHMNICGKSGQVTTVESKYGDHSCTHQGAQVLLMIDGLEKEDLSVGEEISFEMEKIAQPIRPRGKLIIA
ncbi:MAG: hypothetical protein HON47_02740 [Candidatus Diapherotrites archaeon]|jgi:hypothetical protein|uniref:Uncharacterized protein n=1 Tax=Candidatus Iainarchaeum sp. TaxID=3101447 RepID=A0A8T5GER9_9ARCH|nr:hypothetical protein [Candidatus Diapherotrites archaeon]MBT7241565.1 hypothetical protein [Candidatus Diapherotrites archaeon]